MVAQLARQDWSRRRLLGVMATGGAAALAGCSVNTGSGSGQSDPKKVVFPDFPTKLTQEDVTLRWVDTGARKTAFVSGVLKSFTRKHPNIKTNYNPGGWQIVNKVVPLGIRNHNAPDVFTKPQGVPVATMINQNWVRPLDDIIPDFEKWKAAFPETAFIPGIHVFNGKTYTWPMASSLLIRGMCVYDKNNLAKAGYDDPGNQIKSWDDLYTALKKIVKSGKTGLMTAVTQFGQMITELSHTAGWNGIGGIDLRTGKYVFDADEVLQAYEFVDKLITDKLLVPGYLNRKTDECASQMPAGKSGVFITIPVYSTGWKANNPQWQYIDGVLPSPDGSDYTMPYQALGAHGLFVYSETKLPEAIGQIYGFMGSPEGQEKMIALTLGSLASEIPAANKKAEEAQALDKHAITTFQMAKDIMRSAPLVPFRNLDVSKVDLVRKQVVPTWQKLWEGIFTGQIKNVKAELTKWNGQQEKSLEVAIATAKKEKGSTITRDDWKFPNWDPSKNYTLADYKELPDYKGTR